MGAAQFTWEDEDNNRLVALAVDYIVDDASVRIDRITPQSVTFLCPENRTPLRSIGVRTEKGRSLLVDAFHKSGQVEQLTDELQQQL